MVIIDDILNPSLNEEQIVLDLRKASTHLYVRRLFKCSGMIDFLFYFYFYFFSIALFSFLNVNERLNPGLDQLKPFLCWK